MSKVNTVKKMKRPLFLPGFLGLIVGILSKWLLTKQLFLKDESSYKQIAVKKFSLFFALAGGISDALKVWIVDVFLWLESVFLRLDKTRFHQKAAESYSLALGDKHTRLTNE